MKEDTFRVQEVWMETEIHYFVMIHAFPSSPDIKPLQVSSETQKLSESAAKCGLKPGTHI